MKSKSVLYAPLLFSAVLLLAGTSSVITLLIERFSEEPFLANTIIQLLVFLLPMAFYCRVRSINPLSGIQVRYVAVQKIPFILVVSLLFFVGTVILRYFGLFFLDSAFVDTPSAVSVPVGVNHSFLMILGNVILPAVFEEVLFRFLLLGEYRSYGSLAAVVMTSLMFAMLHFSLENFLYYFFMGAVLGLLTEFSGSLIPGIVLHIIINYSYFNFRPVVVEYLRQAGKSPLMPYLLLALFLFLFVMLFSRLENLYQDKVYEEMLRSRKELLRQEVEKTREAQEQIPQVNTFYSTFKDLYLSPTFLVSVAIFIAVIVGTFSAR